MLTKWGPWIPFNGDKCPCVGKMAEVCYTDTEKPEIGIAEDHVYWRFVWRYRLAQS